MAQKVFESNLSNLPPIPSNEQLIFQLRYAMTYFLTHKLNESAKWIGELLLSVNTVQMNSPSTCLSNQNIGDQATQDKYCLPICECNNAFYLAQSLFDLKEFGKCSFILRPYATPNHPSAMFLYYYTKYILSEQSREEEIFESNEQVCRSSIINKELIQFEKELKEFFQEGRLNDLNSYLLGLILKQRGNKEEAKEMFIYSLMKNPLLWGAWIELCPLLKKNEWYNFSEKINSWVTRFYLCSFCIEIHCEQVSIQAASDLMKSFPTSNFIFGIIANANYTSQEFDYSLDFFEKLKTIDPYRYESIDLYSNILYIKENYAELANLAYFSFQNHKYRPETCCVIGNYYSLRGDHEKAIIYFKRALKLDSNFLSAWTLMGHEYLEMKNTQAAIESYRTAVDIDPKDFRAWYGLGQTYEIHQMHNFAAYYYANAAMSRPQDSRMWCALAGCYEKMGKSEETSKCLEKAEKYKDKEGLVLHRLAKLYLSINDIEKAALCFQENLKRKETDDAFTSETVEALMFLSKYFKDTGKYEEAVKYASRLHDYNGSEREEAKALIREIQNLSQHN